MSVTKMIRHLGDFIHFVEEELLLTLRQDFDPRMIKILVQIPGNTPVLAGRVDFVKTHDGELALLVKPFLGNPSKELETTEPGGNGGESA